MDQKSKKKFSPKKPRIPRKPKQYNPRVPKQPVTNEDTIKSIEKLGKSLKDGNPEDIKKDFVRVVGHFNRVDNKYNDKFKTFQGAKEVNVAVILGIVPLIVLGLTTIGIKHQNLVIFITRGFKEYMRTKEQPKTPLEILSYKEETNKLKIINDVMDKIFDAFKKVDSLEKLVLVSSIATIMVDEIPALLRSLGSLPNVSLTAKVNEALIRSLILTRTIQKNS